MISASSLQEGYELEGTVVRVHLYGVDIRANWLGYVDVYTNQRKRWTLDFTKDVKQRANPKTILIVILMLKIIQSPMN